MPKTLFIHHGAKNFSGAQKMLYGLVNQFYHKEVVFYSLQKNALCQKLKEDNYKIVVSEDNLFTTKRNKYLVNLFNIFNIKLCKEIIFNNIKLYNIVKNNKVDNLWIQNLKLMILFYPVLLLLSIKRKNIIWNIWSEPTGFIFKILSFFAGLISNKIVYEYEKQPERIHLKFLSKAFRKKSIVANTPIEIDFKNNSRHQNDAIVMAGNINKEKGQFRFIKAITPILKRFDKKLYLLGRPELSSPVDIEYYESIKKYIRNNNLTDYIILEGWVDNVGEYFESSCLYVSSSESESYPVAIREAISFGLPIVAFNVGGTSEMVRNCYNGYLLLKGDFNNIKFAIETILSNQFLWSLFSNNNEHIYSSFSDYNHYADMIKSIMK